MEQRLKRLNDINELIKCIGENDVNGHRPILHGKDDDGNLTPGYFKFSSNGLLYYVDSYTRLDIRPIESAHRHRDTRFSEGGNLWWLILSFAQFIMTGKEGALRDYKEIWAFEYERTMNVRKRAKEIGFISSIDYPYYLYPKSC